MHLFKIGLSTLIAFSTPTATANEVTTGDAAPLFKAMDQDNNAWSPDKHTGEGCSVLYFYPAAITGDRTKQAGSYRDYVKENTPQSLKYFQKAENLNFTLLSDPDGKIAKAHGVPVRTDEKTIKHTVDGKEIDLLHSSTASSRTFIISQQGKIVYRLNPFQSNSLFRLCY